MLDDKLTILDECLLGSLESFLPRGGFGPRNAETKEAILKHTLMAVAF